MSKAEQGVADMIAHKLSDRAMVIGDLTRRQLESIPHRNNWDDEIGLFDSLILLPARRKEELHDSGYRCIDFVAVREGKAICRLSGCSDVLHINGIGGYGKFTGTIPDTMPIMSWNMDCLPRSGLMQLFCAGHKLRADPAMSSFSVYAVKE